MATQTAEDFGIKSKSLKELIKEYNLDIPTTGTIRIKPFANSVGADKLAKSSTWGTVRRSGWFRIKQGDETFHPKEWNYMGRSLELHGKGMLLDMTDPSHRNLYAIFMYSEDWKGVVVVSQGQKTHHSRFFVFNPEAEAVAYLKSQAVQDEMIDMVRDLNDSQLPLFGLIFNVTGTNTLIRATLRQMCGTPTGCKKIGEIMLSPDREYMETIAVAESQANPNAPNAGERGLFKASTNIYYWNDTSLGVGIGGCTAYLKAHPDLYRAIRQLYFGEKPADIKIPKVIPTDEVSKAFQAQADKIVNLYNGGTKDPKEIAKATGVQWKRCERILKENKDRLKD